MAEAVRRRTRNDPTLIKKAALQNRLLSKNGLSERLFAHVFKGLVYPQIWEDPDVDMAALQIAPGHNVVTIASGGCNALSYLTADPARIEAVDLNTAHVAFNRLKHAALTRLPDHAAFYRFYGKADDAANIAAYDRLIAPHLDAASRAYWEKRDWRGRGRRRIAIFSRDLYRHGLLGWFIGMGHRAARLYGVDPADLLKSGSLDEQRAWFDTVLAPLFDKRMVRWATRRRASLFGLGIPPQQYAALASSGGDISTILRGRLEKLACGFPLSENYFAWQAFGRSYGDDEIGPLPPYLDRRNYETVRARADRFSVTHASMTDFLAAKDDASVDRFVLLDAQDWMTDQQLNELWREITRTARPGARVIFRTAAQPTILPGRVDDAVLSRWTYHEDESQALHARDRSSIYGGFHLYALH